MNTNLKVVLIYLVINIVLLPLYYVLWLILMLQGTISNFNIGSAIFGFVLAFIPITCVFLLVKRFLLKGNNNRSAVNRISYIVSITIVFLFLFLWPLINGQLFIK
ncbi:hypothetical protein SAMN05192533_10541 [Mesobacillus persicus]|uniref:Uncharacterized protein n=1 Tax=Mesobacillus persicus TaxID=930146 RepID=A0A1H8AJF8_9BACI|nr:hypothetical protein [Mesobacillus persicus]SEM70860.1 hypothetical protein SAMN05192533_10541 [Mesobacillus persicus]